MGGPLFWERAKFIDRRSGISFVNDGFGSTPPFGGWTKREHGADDPNGAKTVAAPATVSGEPYLGCH